MKKLLVLMMVLALCALSALAEAPAELNWSDFQSITDSVEGSFYTFNDIALQMWVPNYFQDADLSEDEVAQGFLSHMTTPDGAYHMAIQYVDVNGMSLEEYANAVSKVDGVSNVTMMTVNGLPCVNYDVAANDVSCVSFTTESGKVLEFSFSPISDEGFSSLAACMIASIQPEQ